MFQNQKIGIGIITCNRPQQFKQLLDSVCSIIDIDEIVIIKNKKFNYDKYDPKLILPNNTINIIDDLGIGVCKNAAIKQLLNKKCYHIFLIEDDIKIKDKNVFQQYIETANAFNLQHLNFGRTYDTLLTYSLAQPFLAYKNGKYAIDLYRRLSGAFQYFTATAIQQIGLMDENFINALEHCEHTYRLSKVKLYTPFYAFADVHNSEDLLMDMYLPTTIKKDNLYEKRCNIAAKIFKEKHGISLKNIPFPTKQQILTFLTEKIQK